ncbi:NAD(P)H-dependent oxidoreductase [Culicoidibacter larvae]|uniref:NAD(P)H-dependent oxidoreductase n=1 Tax=Culicoidibacter larvae TaxID=2579976 RepID=A0A5R8QBK6_9FIRM|nr:NAD(P)H-dependent oxidoreductase [Culicoidibacter larvae]TLG73892.1 NAD(P)H-dependent oxidoreductase [Culicoidibacter larvae]
MTDTVIINGNPNKNSISNQIIDSYQNHMENNNIHTKRYNINEIDFNEALLHGYKTELTVETIAIQQEIQEAKLLVIYVPIYWGSFPGPFKSLFDQLLWPKVAFNMATKEYLFKGLWRNKQVRIIYSLGGSEFEHRLLYHRAGIRSLKYGLRLTGIFSTKTTALENFDNQKRQTLEYYQKQVRKAAAADLRRIKKQA